MFRPFTPRDGFCAIWGARAFGAEVAKAAGGSGADTFAPTAAARSGADRFVPVPPKATARAGFKAPSAIFSQSRGAETQRLSEAYEGNPDAHASWLKNSPEVILSASRFRHD